MKMKQFLGYLLVSLVVSSLTILGYHHWINPGQIGTSGTSTEVYSDTFDHITPNASYAAFQSGAIDGATTDFTKAAERSMPAVVHIKSIKKANYSYNRDPFFDFFGFRPQRQGNQELVSTGSGVIISPDGYIVTNNHVIADGDRLEVTLYDNRSYMATVIGTDPSTDLGLIKIEEAGLPATGFANSDNVRVGEWVVAVGNPFNLSSTVTAGIVSAIGRDLEIIKDRAAIESFIQTDAAVNPGNSGGALVNLEGNLVGINTAISSPTGAYAGYAFAVPVNIVRKVVGDLKQFGTVQRGFLGIREVYNLNGTLAKELNLDISEGVVIEKLSQGGAAEMAGVRRGDVIVKADGISIKSDNKLSELLARKRPGDQIELSVLRKGKPMTFTASLTNQQGTTDILAKGRSEFLKELGADFGELNDRELAALARYDILGGVKVTKLYAGKLRQSTSIREGFVILKVDGQPITDSEELTDRLENTRGNIRLEGYYPGSTRLFAFDLEL